MQNTTSGQTRGRIAGYFSLGQFNVTLDYFCGRPNGTLVDSIRGNPDVTPSKDPLSTGIWIPMQHIVPWAHPSPHAERHLDRFSRFCTVHCRYRQTDRQTTLLRL